MFIVHSKSAEKGFEMAGGERSKKATDTSDIERRLRETAASSVPTPEEEAAFTRRVFDELGLPLPDEKPGASV